ncbi:MAG: 23S rRNA (uracil(1939)-C(5))-methyltransferase RlmD [Erysipelotrichaceae bacterium]|nr:23S rRNA (uracil(1939)-C(5))-methyltransferase RlmD [Erysipelotrichaceae bacterium]
MKNDIVTGKCTDMTIDGLGIARADELVVFVKEMIPGETARIRITKEKKNYSYGIIEELLEPSKFRRKPDCPIAYKCGGCDLRHIDYGYQLELKKKILANVLKPYKVADVVCDDDPYYYRNKVQIPCRDGKMGFYRRYSNDIMEFDDCLIESRKANEIIADLKKVLFTYPFSSSVRHILIKHGKMTDEIMVGIISSDIDADYGPIVDYLTERHQNIRSIILNLNDRDTNVILGDKEKVIYGNGYICDIYDGIKVKISLKSFYQVNHGMMLKLYGKILELAQISENTDVLDLYCGIGTISLYLARYCRSVTGVEIVKEAVDNAMDNAEMNGMDNARFILADASKGMDEYLKDKDVLIVDPPRKGLSESLIRSIINSDVERMVYVSCNPVTLARDLKLLNEAFDLDEIVPFDMFGYTVHVECVTCLERKR